MKKDAHNPRIFSQLIMMFLIAAGTMLTGCGGEKEKGQLEMIEMEGKPGFIGLSLASLSAERWVKDRKFFMERVRKLGGEVVVKNAREDAEEQVKQCRKLVDGGARILVIIPENSGSAGRIVDYAHSKNVKVISYDRLITKSEVDLYVSFDNVRVGEIQAQAMLNKVPRGNYMILKGDPEDKNSEMIYTGHMNILKPVIANGHIKILATKSVHAWSKSEARKLTVKALEKYRLDAIIASNDRTAAGVISALIERGLEGKVPVSGQDADLSACRYLVKGFQEVTVYKPLKKLAELAAEQAIKGLRGVEFDTATRYIRSGRARVPALVLEPVTVNKWNLRETVIADGFHSQEEIYEEPGNGEGQKVKQAKKEKAGKAK